MNKISSILIMAASLVCVIGGNVFCIMSRRVYEHRDRVSYRIAGICAILVGLILSILSLAGT